MSRSSAKGIVPASFAGQGTADTAYQLFRAKLMALPPWSVWEDDVCAGPTDVRLAREVLDDYAERAVFGALTTYGFRHWSLSIALAEAVLKDAEERLATIQIDRYSRTVGARMVTAYSNLAKRLDKELKLLRGHHG